MREYSDIYYLINYQKFVFTSNDFIKGILLEKQKALIHRIK